MRTVKQVIIVRHDLQMNKGKFAVQVAHASCTASYKATTPNMLAWENEGSCKICLQAKDLPHLLQLKDLAVRAKLTTSLITDAGVTVFNEPQTTCLAIGPNKIEEIDLITKDLKLW